jgi:hypothetical protein
MRMILLHTPNGGSGKSTSRGQLPTLSASSGLRSSAVTLRRELGCRLHQ